MEIKEFEIEGVYEILPRVFEDERGYFLETYHEEKFKSIGIDSRFVQSNQSYSIKGVLRGLHFQKEPYAQAKLVRVVQGKVLDIAVDLRPNSPTFGQHCKCFLSAEKQNLFFIPEGFAHGFVALENCIFQYQCSNVYHFESESGIIWNDPDLNIDWEIINPLVSEKDDKLQSFNSFRETL